MTEYASGLLVLSLVLAVGARLVYDRRYASVTGLLFSLILLSNVATPLASLTEGDISLPIKEVEVDTSAFENGLAQAYASGIRRALCDRFSLAEADVFVCVTELCAENIGEARVSVILSGRAALADRHRIEEYLKTGGVTVDAIQIRVE